MAQQPWAEARVSVYIGVGVCVNRVFVRRVRGGGTYVHWKDVLFILFKYICHSNPFFSSFSFVNYREIPKSLKSSTEMDKIGDIIDQVPDTGDFDLKNVLESTYFFSWCKAVLLKYLSYFTQQKSLKSNTEIDSNGGIIVQVPDIGDFDL